MKRLLNIFVALFATLTVAAQAEKSIVIEQKTFRAVQTDALTGVNIDPIGLDSSKRPCARLKVKINRMTKAEIDDIEVKLATNNQLTKNKTAEYDNGLILELTAKPQTRFYFHHDEFGDSNEVCLDLEADKEYYLEAYLNQSFSIVVNSNVAGADVYLDSTFKGQTESNMSCTISDVMIGSHTLKLVYGSVSSEQSIDVNKNSIYFRQSVNIQASEPQFVVFAVEPQNAVVTIDNKHYALQDGAMRVVLDGGTYNYTVTAAGYHPQSGTFTIAGEKIVRNIALTADVATVTLTAPDNAEIWVNEELKGVGSWNGTLASGTYIFEARKSGHKSSTISKHITSDNPQQSYTLIAPTPIYGKLLVDGTPLMADVVVDGINVGQTPLQLNNILVGEHTVIVSKEGYNPYTQKVTISETIIANINATLSKFAPLKGITPIEVDNSLSAEQLCSKGVEFGEQKDYNAAVQYFYASTERGYVKAMNELGYCYEHGLGVLKNHAEAVKWYRKSAEQGYPLAQSNLGYCYQYGKGVEKDYTEAVKWYRKSVEQGNAMAQNNLGICYQSGQGVEKDNIEAVKWYRKAAEQENSLAQNNLGYCYFHGLGVTKDYTEAVKWYRRSAEQGYARGEVNLGWCYETGSGVAKNYKEAVKWYRKAAEQGAAHGQHNLAVCYLNGYGVTQNFTEGFNLTKKAAEQGHVAAYGNMGWCYENGKGVAKNRKTAISWYRKGAENGDTYCKKALKRLGVK